VQAPHETEPPARHDQSGQHHSPRRNSQGGKRNRIHPVMRDTNAGQNRVRGKGAHYQGHKEKQTHDGSMNGCRIGIKVGWVLTHHTPLEDGG